MSYASEKTINALKKGRETKGLSQRALSARTGVPQSHISKIENGSADIRLSSLIELARALDLEVKLVPRKALPAVDNVVRSIAPAAPATETYRNAIKEFQRTLGTVDKLRLTYPDLSALNRLQESLRTISHFKTIDEYLGTIKSVTRPLNVLQKQADQLRQSENRARPPAQTIKQIEKITNRVQNLRTQLVRAVPSPQPRPAYRLDEDDDDYHERKDLGDV